MGMRMPVFRKLTPTGTQWVLVDLESYDLVFCMLCDTPKRIDPQHWAMATYEFTKQHERCLKGRDVQTLPKFIGTGVRALQDG